ncbi:MAG TPA: 50S ribosomal protein L4 [Firmicutes bacterium]|nr:50S ribosomal protein L4 [Bacillota bacterium]
MPTVSVVNVKGEKVGEVVLPDAVFAVEVNEGLMHDAVVAHLASQRRGTHDTKTRGEVSGGGRKPWRQKGTGRARQGSIRAPQWTGGGTVFGPTPREYGYRLPKKMRRLALKSALSAKTAAGEIVVLDELKLPEAKTKEMAAVLNRLGAENALVVTAAPDTTLHLASRNIPGVKTMTADGLNVYDILNHARLVMTREAVDRVGEVLA